MDAVRHFVSGFWSVPRATALLLRAPRLRKRSAIPTVVSILLLVLLVALSFHIGPSLVERFWTSPGDSSGWRDALLTSAHLLVKALTTFLLIVFSGAVFFFGSAVVAEPFIEPLSRATERELGVEVAVDKSSIANSLRDIALTLRDVCGDVCAFAALQFVAMLLGFIPGIGAVCHVVLAWMVNALFSGLEMSGEALARRGFRGR